MKILRWVRLSGTNGRRPTTSNVCFEMFPALAGRRRQLGGTLSGGEQQMLAIGRALMAKPKLLLLDEPSLGLAPIIVSRIFKIIKEINQQGTTILLVEQNAKAALRLAHRAYVMETGKIVMQGRQPCSRMIRASKRPIWENEHSNTGLATMTVKPEHSRRAFQGTRSPEISSSSLNTKARTITGGRRRPAADRQRSRKRWKRPCRA